MNFDLTFPRTIQARFVATKLLLLGAFFASTPAAAATIVGVPCFDQPVCATKISDLHLSAGRFDVEFRFAAFYETFPDPTTFLFWGDPAGATEAATAIAETLAAAGIARVGQVSPDPAVILFTNGLSFPYRALNEFTAFSIAAATFGYDPTVWVVYPSTMNLQGALFPIFTSIPVPEPATSWQLLAGLLALLTMRKGAPRSQSTKALRRSSDRDESM